MRVPDAVLKCIGFVSRYSEKLEYRGTAFVVGVPYDETSGCLHLVTAKHVALQLAAGDAVIAMNGKDGLPLFARFTGEQWFYHPTDESVDVAVLPFASRRVLEYGVESIPIEMFATAERIALYGIGLGDEIINVGLFAPHAGTNRLQPIVRTGNVATMTQERVPSPQFGSIEAILVEGRSIGGLSGSPVFVRNTVNTTMSAGSGQMVRMSGLGEYHLLGLMHGHFDAPAGFSEPATGVNMGISIVVPAQKILETLFSPALVAAREKAFSRTVGEPSSED